MKRSGIKQTHGLGTIKNIKDLRDKVARAKNNSNELINLLCKDFNIRQSEEATWLSFDEINNEEKFDIDEIRDCYAVAGVDLSSTTDLTCATIMVQKNQKKYVLQQYFIAADRLEFKIKDDKIPYDIWEKRGLVTVCEGAKVDYSKVTEWIMQTVTDYGIRPLWIGYDPWNSNYWIEEMKANGFDMVEIRQGPKTMSSPMKELGADLIDKKVIYNDNPVLKWCLCNTQVKADDNDNIRPVKGKKQRARIDGAVSLIIAYCVLNAKMNDYMSLQGD